MAFLKSPICVLSLLFLLSAQSARGEQASAPAEAGGTVSAAPLQQSPRARRESLFEQNSSTGSTGLLHLALPVSGAAGTLRFSFLADWFTGSDFLCNSQAPCGTAVHASETHLGSSAALSVTPLPFLEAFANLHSFASTNDQQSPSLIQVLSNATFGVKAFAPELLANIFGLGGSAELRLLNGSGAVGPSGKGTSFRLAALASADLRGLRTPLPLRITSNVGYFLDNSAKLLEDTERDRGTRVTRFERFGLGVNRVDQVELGLGVEAMLPYVRPFVEWNVRLPSNRQSYSCNKAHSYSGDQCLANQERLSAFPSALTLGARAFPVLKGLSLTAAVDIGTSGSSNFVEELAPTLPWDLWLGFGYAFDLVEPPPERVVVVQKEAVPLPAKPTRRIRGVVHEKGKQEALANAIIRYSGRSLTAMASGADGRFVSEGLEPGTYTFSVEADGFKPGECSVTLPAESGPPALLGSKNSAPSAPAARPAPVALAAASAPVSPEFFDLDCELEALPRAGNVVGRVSDGATGAPIADATVELRDTLGRSLQITTDESGRFRFERVLPGTISVNAQARVYLLHSVSLTVRPREDANVERGLRKRAKMPLIDVTPKEIKLRQQIHFEKDSAAISSDSSAVLEEVADALARAPRPAHAEIQGHTDDSGAPDHDKSLSEARASSVLEWLSSHGIEASRLSAKGYGKERPISPNVTPQGRARNRRIQIMLGD